jgi:oligosaccharide repeat unit polymerase
MLAFLFCGIAFFLYVLRQIKTKVLSPGAIFSVMWGLNCIYQWLIYIDYVNPLTFKESFDYKFLNTYIIYFTFASLIGFMLADTFFKRKPHLLFTSEFVDFVLRKYKFIMWLNFIGGILRIVAVVQLIGFDPNNVLAYRMVANGMMTGIRSGFAGTVFRITAYIIMLANAYVALAGLKSGLGQLKRSEIWSLFILYMPSQLATGGRLFVLYFVIFYFGCFVLGRGIAIASKTHSRWLKASEFKSVLTLGALMVFFVVAISTSRMSGGMQNIGSEKQSSALDSFSYVAEGTMVTEHAFQFYANKPDDLQIGKETLFGNTQKSQAFIKYKHSTVYASSVFCIIYPLYIDFGYWGSIMVWSFLAFFIQALALSCLNRLTIMRFLIYVILLKVCYETIIANSIASNLPFYELLLLFAIFYRPIFGRVRN